MVVHSKSYTVPIAESTGAYKFWKDVSFFGCVISGILLAIVVFKLLSPENTAENTRIAEHIEAMQTDPFWQEKIAREELNMALPDEIIYKFTE
jgi:hypothetical protein